jgi:hypothetical protein
VEAGRCGVELVEGVEAGAGPAGGARAGVRRWGQREADVEQHRERLAVLGALDQGGEQGGPELGPVGQVQVGQGGDGVQHLDHGDRHPSLAEPVEELEQRRLQ